MRKVILDMEEEFIKDTTENGLGFIIDTPIPIQKGVDYRNPRGIYSNLFGGDINDTEEIQKRYICSLDCEEPLIGKFREGMQCPHCGNIVQYHSDDIEKTGWIVLPEPYRIIPPKLYHFLESIFGKSILKDILQYERQFDQHGNFIAPQYITKHARSKYSNIGLVEFAYNFDKILDDIGNKNKSDEISFIKKHRRKLFTSYIPVISLALRPVMLVDDSAFNTDKLNSCYSEIVAFVKTIKDNILNGTERNTHVNTTILWDIQQKYLKLDDMVVDEKINGKKQAIKARIVGARVNFCGRHVIVPNAENPTLDGIIIPYYTFVEFYKFHIMRLYKEIYSLTIYEIQDRWYDLISSQDPSIMNIIQMLIQHTKNGLITYNNRNPTLNLGSIKSLKILGVNKDMDDYTVKLPLNCIRLSGGDFDGDQENLMPLIDQNFAEKFDHAYNPESMTISAANGRFNRKMHLLQDQLVALYSFCNDDFDSPDEFIIDPPFTIVDESTEKMQEAIHIAKVQGTYNESIPIVF